jgi:hypothetical protein
MVSLPQGYNKPSDNIENYIWLFGGEKKIGKTDFSAQWPDHYILEGEPGNAKHLNCRYSDVFTWPEALQYLQAVKTTPNYCKTLVIDDVNSFYRMLIRHTKKDIFKLADEEPMQIKHWDYPREQFYSFFQQLRELNTRGLGIVLTNHIDIKTVQDIYGKEYSQLILNFGNQAKEIIDSIAHFVGIMMRTTTGERHIYLKGTSFVKCGHGFTSHFVNPQTLEELAYIEMGKSAKEAYQNFVAAFNNQYTPTKPTGALEKTETGQQIPKPTVTKIKPVIQSK